VAPRRDGPRRGLTELESLIRAVLRAFAEASVAGCSWRSISTFRFMENCFVELLRIDDATTYRVGYVCIRQLALVLRSACIATSQSGDAKAAADKEKQRKRKGLQAQQAHDVVAWPFMRAAFLWTKAIGSLPCLRPLAYPLSTIVSGALKTKLSSVQYFPFVYHCFRCLNRLAALLEVFVPVAAHLLKVFSILLPTMEKSYKKLGARAGGGGGGRSTAKAPEVDVLLRFGESQSHEVLTLETIGSSLCFLFTDHLGLLCRSPSFPEVVAPVLFHLRKHSKCRSEPLRRQLRQLIATAETTAEDLTARRECLTEVLSWKRFFIFEADSAMARARADALARLERNERARCEAERQEERPPKKRVLDDSARSRKLAKRQRQNARRKEERKAAQRATTGSAAVAEEEREEGASGAAAPPGEDIVEDIAFSSGEDD